MKLAIVGSRSIQNAPVDKYLTSDVDMVISGGAKGVDTFAVARALELGIDVEVFVPDYERYGRRAPLIRNAQIAEACDRMVVLWDGRSTGCRHAEREARLRNKPVWIEIVS